MNTIDWKAAVRVDSRPKLTSAEIRLNDTLQNLMTRWVNEEHIPITHITQKLDVSGKLVYKLIDLFGLREQADKNSAKIKKGAGHRLAHKGRYD